MFVNRDDHPVQPMVAAGGFEASRQAGDKPRDHGILVHADDAVVRARHAGVGEARCPAGQDALIRRLHVGVGANHRGDLAIEVVTQRLFLRRRLGVHVDEDHLRAVLFHPRDFPLGDAERIVDGVEEHAAHHVDHAHAHAARRRDHARSRAWRAVRIVGRPNQSRLRADELQRFAFVPHVIAAGHHVHARGENLMEVVARDADPARGVFTVGNDEISLMRGGQGAHVTAYQVAPRPADNVANKEEFHPLD